MLSKKLQSLVQWFVLSADAVALKVEQDRTALASSKIYSEAYKNGELSKIDAASQQALERVRAIAHKEIVAAVDGAIACIDNAILERPLTEFEELKNILEASAGDLSPYEIRLLCAKYRHSYWAMKFLHNATSSNETVHDILAQAFTMPRPEAVIEILQDEMNMLLPFVATYTGISPSGDASGTTNTLGKLLVNGDHWAELSQRLSVFPEFLTDNDLTAPALRSNERRELEAAGISLDVNDSVSKRLVRDAARKGGTLRNILTRTAWAGTVQEEEKRMVEELEDSAQIEHGSYGREMNQILKKISDYQRKAIK